MNGRHCGRERKHNNHNNNDNDTEKKSMRWKWKIAERISIHITIEGGYATNCNETKRRNKWIVEHKAAAKFN